MMGLLHPAAAVIAGGPEGVHGSAANLRWVGLAFIAAAIVVGCIRLVACRGEGARRMRITLDILAGVWLLVGVVLGAVGLALA
jgi:hypothetical protein